MKPVYNYHKFKVPLWVLGSVFFLIISRTVLASTVIAWKEEAAVTGPTLTLGDLAFLSGDDPARVAALRAINMGQAPDPGQTRNLTQEVLFARLTAEGVNPSAEGWTLPGNILVTTLSQTVSRDLIQQKVAEAIYRKAAYPRENITLITKGRSADVQIPVGTYEINVKFPGGIRFVGPTQVLAEIWLDRRLVKSMYLVYDIEVSINAYVTKSAIPAHQFITAQDVAVEKKTLSGLPAGAIKNNALLQAYWTRRTLSPGMVLTEDMLDIPPAVKRNSQVPITLDQGGIFLTTIGLALQDGRPGDVIRVQNVETKRIIMAKVQTSGTVIPLGW